ncbi:MAG: hypothetical protein AAF330_02615 [Pseudomonadota bacterium]
MDVLFGSSPAFAGLSTLAALSFVLAAFGFIPYIIDTLAGRTQPARASWLIWSTLSLIAFSTQMVEGTAASLWFVGTQCGFTVFIFLLSITRGSGAFFSRANLMIFAAAAAGLLVWYSLSSAIYALGVVIAISALGGYATVVKAFAGPRSETLSTWVLQAAASLCGLLAVERLELVVVAYPAFLLALYVAIVLAICLGRRRAVAPDLGVVA